MSDFIEGLRRESERLREDCDYSSKGHFESARIWNRWNLWLGVPAVLVAAFAGVSALNDNSLVAAGLSGLGGAITAVLTFLKPSERASNHQKAGGLYSSIRNRARFFGEVELRASQRPAALRKRLKQLTEERNALNEASPEILRSAFEQARKGIAEGESTHKVDEPKN